MRDTPEVNDRAEEGARRSVRDRVYDGLRFAAVVARLLPTAVSFARDRRRWVRWGAPVARDAAFHTQRARRIVRDFAALGPAFVKLAQIFASRSDLIAEPYLSALGTLTDRVPPVPWSVLRHELELAWQAEPESIVDDLCSVPLAAGSLGQVHRAVYQGRDVVVKILRPGVAAVVDRDVRIARWFVDKTYARFPHHHVLGFRIVLDEFTAHVHEEMDFVREGEQCERMRVRFLDESRLCIPRTEAELTRRNVLVMEYMPGTRIDALQDRVGRGEIVPNTLVETLIECYARMMLRDGVFHADPHPGNLLVDDAGRIILLDFGMVINVDVVTRKALFDTIIAAVKRDIDGTTDGFFALGLVAPGTSRDTMRALVRVLLDIAFAQTPMQERSRALADRIMRELFDWPIVLPGELVYFARTAALIEGIGARYDRNFNGIRVATPVVLKLRNELLMALLGHDGSDPVIAWAATLGAVAGGAAAILGDKARQLTSAVASSWQELFMAPRASVKVMALLPSAENPLAKQIEAKLQSGE